MRSYRIFRRMKNWYRVWPFSFRTKWLLGRRFKYVLYFCRLKSLNFRYSLLYYTMRILIVLQKHEKLKEKNKTTDYHFHSNDITWVFFLDYWSKSFYLLNHPPTSDKRHVKAHTSCKHLTWPICFSLQKLSRSIIIHHPRDLREYPLEITSKSPLVDRLMDG